MSTNSSQKNSFRCKTLRSWYFQYEFCRERKLDPTSAYSFWFKELWIIFVIRVLHGKVVCKHINLLILVWRFINVMFVKDVLLRSNLKQHAIVHTYAKSFKCEQCDKCFTRKSNLTTHMLIHSGWKSFQCDICERNFTPNGHLKWHSLLTHTKQKPHECDTCKKML